MKQDQIINADCLDELKKFKDNTIDLIVTSPPYAGKRGDDYDTKPIKGYNEWFLQITEELYRVLKPSGSFVLNIKEPAVKGERSTYIIELILEMKKQGWKWTEEYIWRKTTSFPGKWNNRFRDGWERCLHFTKEKGFTMNQDAVKIPVGDWADSRLKKKKNGKLVDKEEHELDIGDKYRRTSNTKSGLARQVGNWIKRHNVNPDNVMFLNKFNYWYLHILYLLVLIPSMLWIDLTYKYMKSGSPFDWYVVVAVLFCVAIASIILFLFIVDTKIEDKNFIYLASVFGGSFFVFHTLFLDGLIWTVFFNHKP